MQKKTIRQILAATTGVAALAGLIGWVTPTDLLNQAVDNAFILNLRANLNEHTKLWPEERVYLQSDKPFYEPGSTIWFSAYLRDGKNLKASVQSEVLHVDLIGPKGNVEQTLNLIAKEGKAAGDFSLGEEAAGGMYKLKAYTNWQKNDGSSFGFEKEIQVQDIVLPNLKMKLEFEKKAFGCGDEVIAKLELNTNENKALGDYKVRFVASLEGKKITESSVLTDAEGLSYIHFKLPSDLHTTDGLVNVLIDYNGSTESISRAIPIVLNKIKFALFPEGGDLVTNMQSNVAFRALNEFDKPADVEGEVRNSKGAVVETFKSFHLGMGSFSFNPQKDEKYFVKITKPEGIKEVFDLPEALPRGYVMSVRNSSSGNIELGINSSEQEELSVVAQVRGEIYFSSAINAQEGLNKLTIPVAKFPIGVCQITLFDSKGIERAERLAFVHHDKQLSIGVSTDKEKYLPREKVKLTVSVKDERGMPMPANLSLSVVNDQLLSFADDKSGNILTELLLQQDVKGKIEEPGFYFDAKEEKAGKALDYLLMTAGWRKFTWEQVQSNKVNAPEFAVEKVVLNSNVVSRTAVAEDVMEEMAPVANAMRGAGNDEARKMAIAKAENGAKKKSEGEQLFAPVMAIAVANRPEQSKKMEIRHEMLKADVKERNEDARKKAKLEDQNFKRAGFPEAAQAMGNAVANNALEMDQEAVFAKPAVNPITYYRARLFAAPVYDKAQTVDVRTDFRSTVFWEPNLVVDRTGKKTIEFYNSDDISSFRTTIEGLSPDGGVGRTEQTYFTQLPFAMSAKVPVEVATSDIVSIPVTLKNNTNEPLGGAFTISAPDGLQAISEPDLAQTIMPGQARVVYLDYKVLNKPGKGDFTISFKSCGLKDAFIQNIKMVSKGFPAVASFSGQEVEKEYTIDMENVVDGSVKASFSAYPNVVSDLMKGVEGILQEPYGCFEQTSCTAYPNAMVLNYLNSTDSKDVNTLSRANALLDKGYNRLCTFETKEKGYEWFGAAPGHEGLSAYGLLEFADMKKAGEKVDQKMVDRTAEWIMSHKDGKGGFARNQHALHDYGRISNEILNAYIVYAVAEAGYTDIRQEFETSYERALATKDPYMLALMCNAAFKLNETQKASAAMNLLLSLQGKDGSWNGLTHSITYSQGRSLTIETTAIATMAMLKNSGKNLAELKSAIDFIVKSRDGSGTFSSTQGTILALKALTEFAIASKKTTEGGTIAVFVDGRKVAERNYKAGDKGAIVIDSLERFMSSGKHIVKVKYMGVKVPLPYSVAVNWNTFLPVSDLSCGVNLTTRLASKNTRVGETVRYSATLSNLKNTEIPSTMVLIGIPAGLTVQPWQLKEMQEKKLFDYYEVKGNQIMIYYRGMAPNDVKQINLDLKAEVPGEFDAPASSGYLYYTNEFKSWSGVDRIKISKI